MDPEFSKLAERLRSNGAFNEDKRLVLATDWSDLETGSFGESFRHGFVALSTLPSYFPSDLPEGVSWLCPFLPSELAALRGDPFWSECEPYYVWFPWANRLFKSKQELAGAKVVAATRRQSSEPVSLVLGSSLNVILSEGLDIAREEIRSEASAEELVLAASDECLGIDVSGTLSPLRGILPGSTIESFPTLADQLRIRSVGMAVRPWLKSRELNAKPRFWDGEAGREFQLLVSATRRRGCSFELEAAFRRYGSTMDGSLDAWADFIWREWLDGHLLGWRYQVAEKALAWLTAFRQYLKPKGVHVAVAMAFALGRAREWSDAFDKLGAASHKLNLLWQAFRAVAPLVEEGVSLDPIVYRNWQDGLSTIQPVDGSKEVKESLEFQGRVYFDQSVSTDEELGVTLSKLGPASLAGVALHVWLFRRSRWFDVIRREIGKRVAAGDGSDLFLFEAMRRTYSVEGTPRIDIAALPSSQGEFFAPTRFSHSRWLVGALALQADRHADADTWWENAMDQDPSAEGRRSRLSTS
ncbi:hypothetical protein [Pelagicoccus sp. SDUM812003]|uniref:hypothetical protein n=1 Tax=Pelagicoccus sp. SDUM812003 TaxID=3041267 RepID=UPI002812206E|nr:hypothetical protein [Pelagicoccus sp. SDUM812003]